MSTGTVLPLVGSLLVLGLVLLGLAGMVRAGSLDRNGAVGIRTRTTKASDHAWTAGHRAARGVMTGTGAFCLGFGAVAGALALVVPGPLAPQLTLCAVGTGYVGLTVGLVLMVRRADAAARGSEPPPRSAAVASDGPSRLWPRDQQRVARGSEEIAAISARLTWGQQRSRTHACSGVQVGVRLQPLHRGGAVVRYTPSSYRPAEFDWAPQKRLVAVSAAGLEWAPCTARSLASRVGSSYAATPFADPARGFFLPSRRTRTSNRGAAVTDIAEITSQDAPAPMGEDLSSPTRTGYDAHAAQQRWQEFWETDQTFKPRDDDSAERRYVLDMFSYPSGDLHMGHAEAYVMADVVARYLRLRGYDVLHPIGWDSFGLPAENAAIQRGTHPADWTYANIETQARSFHRYGLSVDWSRRLHTSDPEYYRWTQWLFLRFRERGLAYRKASYVNWCPKDQTVLANEQVVQGACERCGTMVVKRQLTQWNFKITEYAQRLLDDMEQLHGGWPERVLTMQRNWIGRSEGAHVDFSIDGGPDDGRVVTVFTTRPDTLYGATFFVVAPDAALAGEIVSPEQRSAFQAYLDLTQQSTEIERQATDRPKTGVFLGVHAINPANGERLPVWAADYVLAEYGTGAIMAVPAHDARDLEFARGHDLPVRQVIDTGEEDPAVSGIATSGDGSYLNSGELDGLVGKEAGVRRMVERLEADGVGAGAITYRLRDWLLSRQRYWGCPIPIIHCGACGEVAVPDDQLPVELPYLTGADLAPQGTSPLAGATDWVNVDCPQCGGPAQRDTDTMDTFVDSSWYFFRYCSPGKTDGPFDPDDVRRWMPVAQYVGGVEHAILHLLYMRFFTKVLFDMGLVDFVEPMERLLNQGQVINQGRAMSKSLGNGVDLGAQIDAFGVDAVRLTVVFAGPPEDDIDWADVSPAGSLKFLTRAHRLAEDVTSAPGVDPTTGDRVLRREAHRLLAEIEQLVESQRFNVVVARVMELVNATRKAIDSGAGPADPAVREAVEVATLVLSLVAPYVAEEMWEALGHRPSVANASWPTVDPSLLVTESVTCVVQVQGKVRARLEVAPDVSEDELRTRALAEEGVTRALAGRTVAKVIVRAPKLVSVVPA